MASLLPGFEYDIFISYRHKDNRYDGWVSEFVTHLKKELEATFKDEVSVYFDENLTDGLLETHDVDQSLKGKLKSAIFIPIISQTYCDPKSFAWRHEFQVFNKLAKEDAFGRDIKLANGNVSSRILPVRIHELDNDDRSLLESELGGVLRGIEFIYKSAGVNRPLKPNDDKKDNAYHTYYRDQINKVANAIKEIISALSHPSTEKQVVAAGRAGKEGKQIRTKAPLLIGSGAVLIVLIGLVFYFYSPSTTARDKSIAVLPFADLSAERDQEHVCDGLMEEILTHLSRVPTLHVISRTSSMKYKGTKTSLKEIANELGVTNILEGSVRTSGNNIRVTVQLIDALTDEHLWSEDFDFDNLKDIFSLETKVSTEVAKVLKGRLTDQDKMKLAKINTENLEAYKLYRRGRYFWSFRTAASYDSAERYFNKAILADPDYALAYAGLADCFSFGLQGLPHQEELPIAKAYLAKALALDSTLCEALTVQGFIESHFEYNWEAGRKTLERALRSNPNYSIARLYYGNTLIFTGKDIEKGLDEVRKAVALDPLSPTVNWALGNRYTNLNRNEEAIKQYRKTLALDRDNFGSLLWIGYSLIRMHQYEDAIKVLQETKRSFGMQPGVTIALAHAQMGETTKAREELKELLSNANTNVDHVFLARLYIVLNEYDSAIAYLEQGYEVKTLNMMSLRNDTSFDPIRNMPRFQAILKKMHYL
jgi:TolB-like protein/Tfp pilus assembly protein PilF